MHATTVKDPSFFPQHLLSSTRVELSSLYLVLPLPPFTPTPVLFFMRYDMFRNTPRFPSPNFSLLQTHLQRQMGVLDKH